MSGRDKAINHKQSSLSVDAEFSNQEKDYHGFISYEVHFKKKASTPTMTHGQLSDPGLKLRGRDNDGIMDKSSSFFQTWNSKKKPPNNLFWLVYAP